ncbi:hypothetical protein QTP86_017097, partial [Hemibagrus guttatus]
MVPQPHSGPSSPQLHSLPYQSPTSSSPTSSPRGAQPSPQANSPVMTAIPTAGPMVHPLAPQQGPFTSEGERLNIKQEPEDREPTFRSIGLQDITLDDAGKMGKPKDLSEFDKGQIVMARRPDQSISKTAALVGCSRSAV